MAKQNEIAHEFGYPDERFETVLSDNLHCAICSCVLKDPVMCKNEHCFCRACITKHLENHQNCPSCNQELTVESLTDAPRIVRNLLSEKRIKCDYYERGCEEIVELGNLASHVAVCGKAPVVCSNEECSREINREDQTRHKSEECRFRQVKCRNCKEMGSMMQEIGISFGGVCKQIEKLNDETKESLTAMEKKFAEMESRFVKMENNFSNQGVFRLGGCGQHERAHDNMEGGRSNQATAVDPSINLKEGKEIAYIVAGGRGFQGILNSAEVFDKTSNSWRELQPMKTTRVDASSVVYNDQVLVAGGQSDRETVSSIEKYSRFWSHFPVNMPKALLQHCSVLYDDRMFIIGGFDPEKKETSDLIYEIQLRFPFITKILTKFPPSIPVQGCGVALVNDKIFMFGGRARDSYVSRRNVTMYDITKNEFKELSPLPTRADSMATVKFEESVILAGGSSSNAVVSYNVETQNSVELPSMKSKRSYCCAVVDGHSMVVMGGSCDKALNSVEAYDFRSSAWRNLPSMKTARCNFIAEII